jgi:NADH-quinone oxidoreductase subunit N
MNALLAAGPPIPHPPLSFGPLAPELVLTGMALVLMLVDALAPQVPSRVHAWLALAGIAGAAVAAAILWNWHGQPVVLGGMVAADRFAVYFRLVILAAAALAVPLSQHYLERTGEWRGEFYPLLLFATTGMTLITAASDLILVFLALELLSLSLYLLTGFSLDRLRSVEGAMKYFLLGAFSSAFFLYGIAMAYGATNATNLFAIGQTLAGGGRTVTAFAILAIGLLATGFGFKIALVPFHMWAPDAYQGAPTPVTAFMSAGTKVAAFAAFLRVFTVALGPLIHDWQPLLAVLAAVSIVVGSVLAIAQTNVKRMLAYSSIAHAGFVLIGLAAGNSLGRQGAMFYLASYAAMLVGAFAVVMLVSGRGERELDLSNYRGLAKRHPLLGASLALFLFSLAGIPPTAGFISKVTVFSAAFQAGFDWLVVLGVVASVVSAFFYVRLVVLMYLDEEVAEPAGGDIRIAPEPSFAGRGTAVATAVRTHPRIGAPVAGLAVAIPAAVTILFGILPQILFGVLRSASVVRF